jgi:Zn-dependent protease with chaperone function/predicted negative regulator of RcsB-dependent stress response
MARAGAATGRRGGRLFWTAALVGLWLGAGGSPARADVDGYLGKLMAQYLVQQSGQCRAVALNRWVQETGAALVAQSPRAGRCHFLVLNSGEVNAESLPGGYICVDAGLLGHVASDDDLAGVLSHELGHQIDHDFDRMLRRQALILLATTVLTAHSRPAVPAAARALQGLDALRQSRKIEAAADSMGVEVCLRGGYDPAGLQDFLTQIGEGQSRWSYWQTLISTHPETSRREQWVADRMAQVLTAPARVQLAEQLTQRARYRQALAHLDAAGKQSPGMYTVPLLTAQVYLLQGRRAEAAAQCQAALRLNPYAADARALLAQAQAPAPPAAPPEAWTPSAELRRQLAEQSEKLAAEDAVRERLRGQVDEETRRLGTEKVYSQALGAAQVVAPGEYFLSSWALLAEAAGLMGEISQLSDQVMEMGWIEYDLPQEITDESALLLQPGPVGSAAQMAAAGEQLREAGDLEQATHRAALESMERAAAAARRLGLEVAPVFLELLASGNDDRPLGPLNDTHAALVQAQLAVAQDGLWQAQTDTDGALHDLCAIKLALYRASLTRLGAQGGTVQDEIYQRVVDQIAGNLPSLPSLLTGEMPHPSPPPGAPTPLAGEGVQKEAPGDLGLAADRALVPSAEQGNPAEKEILTIPRKGPWDDRAYAGYVLMRLAWLRCQEETLGSP